MGQIQHWVAHLIYRVEDIVPEQLQNISANGTREISTTQLTGCRRVLTDHQSLTIEDLVETCSLACYLLLPVLTCGSLP